MKTTVDIPDQMLAEAMRFAKARTKREAIVVAVEEYNRRNRMAEMTKHFGTCKNLISVAELIKMREIE